jgi:hypothetical protein
MNSLRSLGFMISLALAGGCRSPRNDGGDSAQTKVAVFDSARPWRKPGDIIDSILPMPEYLRRFREGLTQPAKLVNGAESRESLARLFLSGVSRRDTSALGNLLITRAEFAWLLFPEHRYAVPPYELDPATFWMQLQAQSQAGFHRLIEHYGGRPITFVGVSCQRDTLQIVTPRPSRTTPTIWSPCLVRYRVSYTSGDSTFTKRLFGSIVMRDGRAKFLTYSNDF